MGGFLAAMRPQAETSGLKCWDFMGFFKVIFFFLMENPPFGESIVNIFFIFWGPLKQIQDFCHVSKAIMNLSYELMVEEKKVPITM
jgi:hypothetical protein